MASSKSSTIDGLSSKKRAILESNEAGAKSKMQRLTNGSGGKSDRLKKSKRPNQEAQEEATEQIIPTPTKEKNNKKPRKSVSFTADTKPSSSSDENLDPQPKIVSSEKENLPDSDNKQRKRELRRQRTKKRNGGKASKAQTQANGGGEGDNKTAESSDPILSYLSLYFHSRPLWKFRKNRETQLLKHALSTDRVPWSYNPALSAYLMGLEGVGARTRVAEAANEAIQADDEELQQEIQKTDTEKSEEFKREVLQYKEKLREINDDTDITNNIANDIEHSSSILDKAWHGRLIKRKRAELVYFLMRGRVSGQKPTANENPQLVKKKRKSRTVVVDDSSSSSSSSESDTSDSD